MGSNVGRKKMMPDDPTLQGVECNDTIKVIQSRTTSTRSVLHLRYVLPRYDAYSIGCEIKWYAIAVRSANMRSLV